MTSFTIHDIIYFEGKLHVNILLCEKMAGRKRGLSNAEIQRLLLESDDSDSDDEGEISDVFRCWLSKFFRLLHVWFYQALCFWLYRLQSNKMYTKLALYKLNRITRGLNLLWNNITTTYDSQSKKKLCSYIIMSSGNHIHYPAECLKFNTRCNKGLKNFIPR